jgi:hypothetical protein
LDLAFKIIGDRYNKTPQTITRLHSRTKSENVKKATLEKITERKNIKFQQKRTKLTLDSTINISNTIENQTLKT